MSNEKGNSNFNFFSALLLFGLVAVFPDHRLSATGSREDITGRIDEGQGLASDDVVVVGGEENVLSTHQSALHGRQVGRLETDTGEIRGGKEVVGVDDRAQWKRIEALV